MIIPMHDAEWCALLADRLSLARISPKLEGVDEIRALLASPPVEMLPAEWHELVATTRRWLEMIDGRLPAFPDGPGLHSALRAMPAAVPAWAEQIR